MLILTMKKNDEVAPDPPIDDENINANSDDEKNDYEVTPDKPTNGGNNETINNDENKNNENENEKRKDNENLNMKDNYKKTE